MEGVRKASVHAVRAVSAFSYFQYFFDIHILCSLFKLFAIIPQITTRFQNNTILQAARKPVHMKVDFIYFLKTKQCLWYLSNIKCTAGNFKAYKKIV